MRMLRSITKSDGIFSNHIYTILPDYNGHLWVGSERGIDYLTFANDTLIHVSHYGTKQGLPGIEVNEKASFIDVNGIPWFGTVEGVVTVSLQNHLEIHIPPQTYITGVSLFGNTIDKSNPYGIKVSSRFQIPNNFYLDYNQSTIGFEFFGINLTSPEGVRYKWILEGFDNDWTEPSFLHHVNYTNLPPGEYTFKVLGSNEDGFWNKDPAIIRFTISAPFWLKTWFIVMAILVVFLVLYSFFQWRLRRLKKAKIHLEQKVAKATKELRKEKELVEFQHEEIEHQKMELEEINQSFTDSINYAERIQRAIMQPQAASVGKIKDRVFVFYKPKDIVSGDFFWFTDKEDSSYIVAADCTGHGVPGAFMSMIGIAFLNQIMNQAQELLTPDKMLFKQRDLVVKALINEGGEESKDGMDMALCRIDWATNKMLFAGANNSVYYVRDSVLTEIKPDKMPIGVSDFRDKPFALHTIDVKKGDMIYLFTDGFADQFGGAKGKKYKYRPFKFFLESIYDFPLEKQREVLDNEIQRWMGDNEQIDDILIIGIRI